MGIEKGKGKEYYREVLVELAVLGWGKTKRLEIVSFTS